MIKIHRAKYTVVLWCAVVCYMVCIWCAVLLCGAVWWCGLVCSALLCCGVVRCGVVLCGMLSCGVGCSSGHVCIHVQQGTDSDGRRDVLVVCSNEIQKEGAGRAKGE